MKYLALDIVDTSSIPKPEELTNVTVTIRGTRNLFDIFFSSSDIETGFNIELPPQLDFTWINTPSGKEKYLSYPTLKRMLFPLREQHELIEIYLTWVDGLLFSNSKVKPFFRRSDTSTTSIASVATTEINTIDALEDDYDSDLDDASSVSSVRSIKTDSDYVVSALECKINQLEHMLELKEKDIQILTQELKFKDKEIELLGYKLNANASAQWV